ncbi:hemin-degrading factor [Thorsellia kenyensis]|uniref:Hemin-degrading factor n=1 Tax=Thorsellia kenyensis TaxID=1549888 RepID=A0ABV6CA30_9GAMM
MQNSHSYETYLTLKAQNPGKYAVDIANLMGISEAELAHIRIGFETTRLDIDAKTLLKHLTPVGKLKAITRNPYAVSEQIGTYDNLNLNGHAGLVLTPRDIDLRIFFSQWQHFFAFNETYETKSLEKKVRKSIQIFNAQGQAIHKIYAIDETDIQAYDKLIEEFRIDELTPLEISPKITAQNNEQTQIPDAAQFEQKWRDLNDVHDFYGLLKEYALSRQQAFKLVSDDLAYQISPSALNDFLLSIQKMQNEIMFFVSNPGCVQIFTGKLEKVVMMKGWLNIFNREFTLHIDIDFVKEAWITRKPTKDGIVTSLELFAEDGTQILQMYGQRTEGTPEQIIWRNQLQTLPVITQSVEA